MKLGPLDQFWRCPKCGWEIAMGPPAQMHPPTCSSRHEPTECEQITAEAFGTTVNQLERGEDA